ncbi:MAG TPA: zinc-binding alcohol dehydrogenase [Planctomycetota bacterium]|nr:zinc-binding alcohol dehydrogenase [Planctomycetota bacterium]
MALPKESKQIIFVEKEKAELQSVPLKAPGAGEITVRTTWTLISTGTETICYGSRFDPGTHWANWIKFPFPPGYSHTGIVEAVGPGVTRYKAGDRVCSTHTHLQYITAPENTFYPIVDGVSERDAAWMTLSYIVQNGVRRASHELGDDVAVIGLGPLGQLAVQFVKLLGARRIIAIDPVGSRLEMAKAHGATHVLNVSVDQALEEVTKIVGERLCDHVYDMTGNAKVFATAQQMLRKLGKLVLIGDTGSPAGQHLTGTVITKSLQIIASHAMNTPPTDTVFAHWTRDNMIALFQEYVRDGRMKVSDLNTHVFTPAECQVAYQKLLHDRASTMGCHFDWSKV